MIVVSGKFANAVGRMAAAAVFSPVADTNFPESNQGNGLPSKFSRFGSVQADSTVTYDLNQVLNGGFETASPALQYWTDASAGASNGGARSTAGGDYADGAAALKLTITTTGGSNQAARYQDIYVKAGRYLHLGCKLKGDGTRTVRLKAQILETGQYLTTTAWSSSPADFATRSTASYNPTDTQAGGVQLPAIPAGMPELDVLTLRITAYMDGSAAGTGLVDSIYAYTANDLFACIGHRYLTPRVSLEVHRSSDNFGSDDHTEGTITAFPQSFYLKFSALRHERYWRLKIAGTPQAAPVLGETLFAHSLTPQNGQDWQFTCGQVEPQVRGSVRSLLISDRPLRSLVLKFSYNASAAWQEARDSILGASRNGAFPMLVVPLEGEADCIYGRLQPSYIIKRYFTASWRELDFQLMELPLPTLWNI